MFDECRRALEDYLVKLRKRGLTKRADHLLQEVRARLRALQWLHARLLNLETELIDDFNKDVDQPVPEGTRKIRVFYEAPAHKVDPHEQATLPCQKEDELRVLLEAFYYTAHRIRDILRDHEEELPGLGGFEARGVRDVRNHLVEHPSRDKGVVVYSVGCGGPVGPRMRFLRWSLDPPGMDDAGLHANAKEFEDELERCLTRATANI